MNILITKKSNTKLLIKYFSIILLIVTDINDI